MILPAWAPQPGRQTLAFSCPVYEQLLGGARGGAKTQTIIGVNGYRAQRLGEAYRGLIGRINRTELADFISEASPIYRSMGAEWHGATSHEPPGWRMPGGGNLWTAHIDSAEAAGKWQGYNLSDVNFEEAGNLPDPAPLRLLHGAIRSGAGFDVFYRLTGNPGGPGHHHLKMRYIDPAPPMTAIRETAPNGQVLERIYIPMRLEDNPALMQSDPSYEGRLALVGGPELYRAWRWGDWDVVAGAFFSEWNRELHVVDPVEVPAWWLRYCAMDWGSASPHAVYWVAVADGEALADRFPRGALVVYREWYGQTAPGSNQGLVLTSEELAEGVIEREQPGETIEYGVLSPDAFATRGGPSIAEVMDETHVSRQGRGRWRRADNRRIARQGAIGGWDQVRVRLRGEDGRPLLYVFATCTELIRTLPVMQHDPDRPEDMADGEDHAVEALRYACMARPWVKDAPALPVSIHHGIRAPTFDELLAQARRQHRRGAGRI